MPYRFVPSRLLAMAVSVAGLAAVPAASFAQSVLVVHWPRTSAEISPPVVNSLPDAMTDKLASVVAAWNQSPFIESPLVTRRAPGDSCAPILGAIRFCVMKGRPNFPAGNQLFYTADGHLYAVRAVVSDEFITSPPYLGAVGRRAVFCYLLGVSYGAPVQDLDPTNADITDASGQQSCLDATSTPEGNENPTPVDMAAIAALYEHSHTNFGIRDLNGAGGSNRGQELAVPADLFSNPGNAVRRDAQDRPVEYRRALTDGSYVVTKVQY